MAGGYVDLYSVNTSSSTPIQLNRVDSEELTSDLVFSGMQDRIDADPSLLKKINGVFSYVITKNGKPAAHWIADLKKGKVYKGSATTDGVKIDTTITIDDDDMVDMAVGKLNPQVAFVKGKLKIKGNVLLAQKLKSLTAESKL